MYTGTMLGSNEVPPTGSTATGFSMLNVTGDTLTVQVMWSGLIGGPASMAHVHCCAPPGTNVTVAVGYTGFPATTSGMYMNTFNLLDASIYTPAFLTFGGGTAAGAEAALVGGLNAGMAYSNIHNAEFPGGEIRANLTAVAATVPEPSTLLLVSAAMLAVGVGARRRKQ